MCGIIAILGARDAAPRLVEGLKRLEYRGYDSAGVSVLGDQGVQRRRAAGKIANLEAALAAAPASGISGVAHTRWATHGPATEANAHPHAAGRVHVVHNGIIENHADLRAELTAKGRTFTSDTDTEVIAHLIDAGLDAGQDPETAVSQAVTALTGAYALAVLIEGAGDALFAARNGSPLAAGVKDGEGFLGSDAIALAGFVDEVTYLEDGDVLRVARDGLHIRPAPGKPTARQVRAIAGAAVFAEKGAYRHFMEKEIHDQPEAVAHTLAAYTDPVAGRAIAPGALKLDRIDRLQIVACGTAFYAAAIAKYWFEGLAGLPVDIDIGSEFRYRNPALAPGAAALAISQSGETADTRAALELCGEAGLTLAALVNVDQSSIARMADVVLPTHAGPEIGVASTKAFTSQLAALAALAVAAGRARGHLSAVEERAHVAALLQIPRLIAHALTLDAAIKPIAATLSKARDVLYLGRGAFYPLALEAALKLKEISYIHAEGYAAGELKHGPIALVDEATPTVVIAPTDALFDKTLSSIQEVAARSGPVVLITDAQGAEKAADLVQSVIVGPDVGPVFAPLVYAVPIQRLAYDAAVQKGTDVDQPRNLAKSVTVE